MNHITFFHLYRFFIHPFSLLISVHFISNSNFSRYSYIDSLCLPLVIIFCFALFVISYIITLCIKGPFFRYMYLLPQNIISSHYNFPVIIYALISF